MRVELGKSPTFRFDVRPGRYALSAFEDLNGNGILDMGMFGPKEPSGFWRPFGGWHKPRSTRSPPSSRARLTAWTSFSLAIECAVGAAADKNGACLHVVERSGHRLNVVAGAFGNALPGGAGEQPLGVPVMDGLHGGSISQ